MKHGRDISTLYLIHLLVTMFLPGSGDGTNRADSVDNLDLVILVTPHLVRLVHPERTSTMISLPSH